MSYPSLAEWWHFPWWFIAESFAYLLVASMLAAALVAAVWGTAWVLWALGLRSAWSLARKGSLTTLLAALFGLPANLLFIAALRYHRYVPADPMVDWVPFFPSGRWVLDENHGGRFINGGSPSLLGWYWLALAVPVWSATVFATARLQRESRPAGSSASRVADRTQVPLVHTEPFGPAGFVASLVIGALAFADARDNSGALTEAVFLSIWAAVPSAIGAALCWVGPRARNAVPAIVLACTTSLGGLLVFGALASAPRPAPDTAAHLAPYLWPVIVFVASRGLAGAAGVVQRIQRPR